MHLKEGPLWVFYQVPTIQVCDFEICGFCLKIGSNCKDFNKFFTSFFFYIFVIYFPAPKVIAKSLYAITCTASEDLSSDKPIVGGVRVV